MKSFYNRTALLLLLFFFLFVAALQAQSLVTYNFSGGSLAPSSTNPSTAGTKNATVTITNNDADEGSYLIRAASCVNNPVVTTTANSGAGSLRDAIENACSGSTITFDPSVFGSAQTITLTSGVLTLDKSLTITGLGAKLLTISGNNADRVFLINASVTATITGVTITDGFSIPIPTAFNTKNGGGIFIFGSGQLTLNNCTISNNVTGSAGNGGGICNNGTLTVTNSTISGNTTSGDGGGILNNGQNATLTVTNSTISGNTSTASNGGGINNTGTMSVSNSTITNNSASAGGGIISFTSMSLKSSIVAGNTAVNRPDLFANTGTSQGYNLFGSGTISPTFTTVATDILTSSPGLGILADNGGPTQTHKLLSGSPALDNGNAFSLTTDQRGLARTLDIPSQTNAAGGDGTDIGAIEMACTTPTFTACPTNKTAFTSTNACTAVVDYVATADGSPVSEITYTFTGFTTGTGSGTGSGTIFNKGITTVTLTATNDCGAPTCQFTVTVTDNVKPVITCPANRTVNADQGQCSSVQTYDVTTTDNCAASTSQTSGQISGAAFPVGTTTNGFMATDAAGNTTACAFTITVVDNQKPVIACPADRTVNADQGQCSSVQTYTVTTTDNCSATTQPTAGLSTGAAFPVGTTINAFLATDAAGNTAICSFSIRVLDVQLPVVTCPANTTLGIGDNCSTPLGSYGLANKSDNCSTAISESQSPVAGTIVTGHNTAQTVTLTATDGGGNTASCSFVVTLKDVMAPSITCPTNVIRSTDLNLCSAVVTYPAPIYSDNCSGGGAVHVNGGTSGSTFAKGTTTVNWQATDGVGLTKTCSFTITVNDGQAPTITCPANIVRGNDAGQCNASVAYPNPTASDNCSLPAGQPKWVSGGTTPTASGVNSVSTFQKGVNVVTWRATDGTGLTKTCTFKVTVNDTQPPTLTCPAPMSLTTATSSCSSVAATYTNPTFTDNCTPASGTATRISGLGSGSSFPLGNSNVVFQATDAAGNTRRCTMVITVTDDQAPVINCPLPIVATGIGIPCKATVFYGSTTASDNCAGTITPFLVTGLASGSPYPAGVTTNTFRAVAPNGQSSECSFSVTVNCGSVMGNNGVEVRNTDLSIQHGDKLELKLAPNPAFSTVNVSIEGVGANGGTLLVFDAVGRLVLRQVIAENQRTAVFQVDGSEFAPGMYMVNLRTEHGMATKTLVVVK
jgi:HYR domain/Secretion system C-terminal sorting domain